MGVYVALTASGNSLKWSLEELQFLNTSTPISLMKERLMVATDINLTVKVASFFSAFRLLF